jgi:hypothetical protein
VLFLLTLAALATGRPSAEKQVFLAEPVRVTPVTQLLEMLAGKVEHLRRSISTIRSASTAICKRSACLTVRT